MLRRRGTYDIHCRAVGRLALMPRLQEKLREEWQQSIRHVSLALAGNDSRVHGGLSSAGS